VAWLTLDSGDNDPVRLWTYLATAVDRIQRGLGRMALQRLRLSASGPIENPIDELMNRMRAYPSRLVLVLDDMQDVTNPEALASIEYGLEHLPDTARLIITTQYDPPFQLGEMRAQGRLTEVRAGDLAFSAEEAGRLLGNQQHVDLEWDEVQQLRDRTEGWPAALVLAAQWLSRVDDPHQSVREFGGDNRLVVDYLSQAVLANLDEEVRAFLLRASVLRRFTTDLCDSVFSRSNSASILSELERANLFVAGLGQSGWFRVHSLFSEYAGLQLESIAPGASIEIHRAAATWLRQRGLVEEAAYHAAAARDDALLADLLTEACHWMLRQVRFRALLHWTRALPQEVLVEHPEIPTAAATAALSLGEGPAETRRFLQLADRAKTSHPARYTPHVEARCAEMRAFSLDDDVVSATRQGRRAMELSEGSGGALSASARTLYMAGDFDGAWGAAKRAIEHPEAPQRPVTQAIARSTLALTALEWGRQSTARRYAEKANAQLGRIGSRTWYGAHVTVAFAMVLANEGKLPEAERRLVLAHGLFEDESPTVNEAWVLLLLARVRCRRGHLAEADRTLQLGSEILDQLVDGGRLPSLRADVELELEQARRRAGFGGELEESPSTGEMAVLRLLATDRTVRQIGEQLFISMNTVRTHTRVLYRKLNVNSRADAVARAQELGLLPTGRGARPNVQIEPLPVVHCANGSGREHAAG